MAQNIRSGAREPASRSARRRTRLESRLQLILDAAAAEFADVGYERATLERIGERVGLSKASLYYYVNGKEQLLSRLLGRFADDVRARMSANALGSGDAVTLLKAFISAHLAATTSTPQGRMLAENLQAQRGTEPRAEAAGYERMLAEILEQGIAAGEIRPVIIRPAVKMILGALNAVSLWYDPAGSLSLDDVADGFVGVTLRGLEAR